MNEDLELKLFLNKPIPIDDIGFLKPLTISQIADLGYSTYNTYLALLISDLSNIDIKNAKSYYQYLVTISQENIDNGKVICGALSLFFDDYSGFANNKFYIGKKEDQRYIEENKFNKIAFILKKQYCIPDKIEKETVPQFANDKQRDIYEKLMEGRKHKREKEYINFTSVINIVKHGGKSFITSKDIQAMTIYELHNSYNTILNLDTFDREYGKYLAGENPKNLHIQKHWTQLIKI